jgi:glycosyltransferase involved in cell wall biosynthesis
MRRGALFLAVSEAVKQRALAQGFPLERTRVHHVGVDLDRFRPDPAATEPGLILHVGRLVEKKGTAALLEAMARLGGDSRLVVVGDGPLRPALERKAVALGLGVRVAFLGQIAPGEVARWMQRAWLIAAPSRTARDGDAEGLPTVLVEAAACGVPAVATDHMGIGEAVIDGESGLLVGERDAAGLAVAMGRLLGDPDLRHRMAAAACRHSGQAFDLARQTAELEQIYDRVVAAGRGQMRSLRSK